MMAGVSKGYTVHTKQRRLPAITKYQIAELDLSPGWHWTLGIAALCFRYPVMDSRSVPPLPQNPLAVADGSKELCAPAQGFFFFQTSPRQYNSISGKMTVHRSCFAAPSHTFAKKGRGDENEILGTEERNSGKENINYLDYIQQKA